MVSWRCLYTTHAHCLSDTLTKGITMAKKENINCSQPPRLPQRRGFVAAATTLLVFPVIPRLAHAAQVVAVRTWPADEYTRVTLELGSELKTEHFTLSNPDRLVVDLHGVKLNDTLKQLNGMVQPNDPYISGVRVGQYEPDVVRLVMDLKHPIAPQGVPLKPVGDYQYRCVDRKTTRLHSSHVAN